jgi:hypothetical protein
MHIFLSIEISSRWRIYNMDLQTASYLEIRIAMLRAGVSFTSIAKQVGEPYDTVMYALVRSRGRRRYRHTPERYARMFAALAAALQESNGHAVVTHDDTMSSHDLC